MPLYLCCHGSKSQTQILVLEIISESGEFVSDPSDLILVSVDLTRQRGTSYNYGFESLEVNTPANSQAEHSLKVFVLLFSSENIALKHKNRVKVRKRRSHNETQTE